MKYRVVDCSVLDSDGRTLATCEHYDTAQWIAHCLERVDDLKEQVERAIRIARDRGPLCRKCEIEHGYGYCRCDPSKYE